LVEVNLKLVVGRNFEINEWKFDIDVRESKLMPYARKNLKVEASLSGNLITSVCTDVRKKPKIAYNV